MTDRVVQYSPHNRSTCPRCNRVNSKGYLRVDLKTRSYFHDGFDVKYYHWKCQPCISFSSLIGWQTLRFDDINLLLVATGQPVLDDKFKQADDELWEFVDQLDAKIKAKELTDLMEANGIEPAKLDYYEQLYFVGAGMWHGILPACTSCKNKLMVKVGDQVYCRGWIDGVVLCKNAAKAADFTARTKFVLPAEAIAKSAFLKNWVHPKPELLKGVSGGDDEEEEEEEEEDEEAAASAAPVAKGPPAKGKELESLVFFASGTLSLTRAVLTKLVAKHGGAMTTKIEEATHVIVPPATAKKGVPNKVIDDAKSNNVPMVTIEFIEGLTDKDAPKLDLLTSAGLTASGFLHPSSVAPSSDHMVTTTVSAAAPAAPAAKGTGKKRSTADAEEAAEEAAQAETKAKGKKAKVEAPVDEPFKLPRPQPGSTVLQVNASFGRPGAQIVIDEGDNLAYNMTFTSVDLESGQNRFYIMQIISFGKQFYLFKKWGRTGGYGQFNGDKSESYKTVAGALKEFGKKFKELTGNDWSQRHNIVQKPGRYIRVHLDDGNVAKAEETSASSSSSSSSSAASSSVSSASATSAKAADDKGTASVPLDGRLEKLIATIFDAKAMNAELARLEIDAKKMPLGKLSQATIMSGYGILKEIETVIKAGLNEASNQRLKALTTRFYMLIPHSFSEYSTPPVINNEAILQAKISALESLMDMAIASELMAKTEKSSAANSGRAQYESLHAKLDPLDKDSKIFKQLSQYLQTTHASTHNQYSLDILDIFDLEREGEDTRFTPFANFDNRQLLWHGSRLTNWVGILSQGLRIAPPEAPSTGYMFGKGVYFANMVSKSANYCFTSKASPTGILMLSEVALGKMYEVGHSEYMDEPRKGFQSTKGFGRTHPDPKASEFLPNGCEIPLGKPETLSTLATSLLYDEFIVYNVAQIKTRYLFLVNFNYKY